MTFGVDDSEAFTAASGSLLGRFEEWLARQQQGMGDGGDSGECAAEAGVVLDWKWSYADGDLGWWRTEHVAEFLLEWCPRKLSVPVADCGSIPEALGLFFRFLEGDGLLAAGSSPVLELERAALGLRDEFVAAMGDSSQFGLAKSLFAAAGNEGVDLSDPADLDQWVAEFNARPEGDRRQVLPDSALGVPRSASRPALPPVALCDEAEVAASKAAAPILGMFARLAEFVGEGRRLTQKGNLTLADARVLVDVLGTGDVVDETIGERTFKTKSAAELPGLRQVFAWAKKAGVVRVSHGKVVATKRGLTISTDPAGCFDRAADALVAIGALSSQRDPDAWFAWPEVNELLDRFVVHLLTGPYVAQRPVPIEDMASVAADAVVGAFVFPSLSDDRVRDRVAVDVVDIMDALSVAGIVERLNIEPAADEPVGRRCHGGSVVLTPAGVATTRRLLVAAGYEAPTAGQFADATAAELLVGTDVSDFPVLWGEVEAWRRRREPQEAVRQLAEAVLALDDPALRNLALAVMADIGVEIAEPEVRKLATEPAVRGFALCWLVDHSLEGEQTLYDVADVFTFVDVLAHRLVTGGPDALVDTLALAGSHEEQIAVIGELWRSPAIATTTVLAALGECHPSKVVAKAARKAAFRRRSWLGQ